MFSSCTPLGPAGPSQPDDAVPPLDVAPPSPPVSVAPPAAVAPPEVVPPPLELPPLDAAAPVPLVPPEPASPLLPWPQAARATTATTAAPTIPGVCMGESCAGAPRKREVSPPESAWLCRFRRARRRRSQVRPHRRRWVHRGPCRRGSDGSRAP